MINEEESKKMTIEEKAKTEAKTKDQAKPDSLARKENAKVISLVRKENAKISFKKSDFEVVLVPWRIAKMKKIMLRRKKERLWRMKQ